MCYVYCKELKGWCKSFTRTEGLLCILEAVLLVVLISFFVFLILHFLACRVYTEPTPEEDIEKKTTLSTSPVTRPSTLSPDVECTWEPSQATTASTRYYLSDRRSPPVPNVSTTTRYSKGPFTDGSLYENDEPLEEYEDIELFEPSDGEAAEDSYKNQVVALVKLKPPEDVTFGCILTKITKLWTLTAASCIESIEDVDSLDSFVIMEGFGSETASRPRVVADVRVHPRYTGAARSHDLAALEADRELPASAHNLAALQADRELPASAYDLAALRADGELPALAPPLRLPRLLDYFLVALGERFHILGYGGYR